MEAGVVKDFLSHSKNLKFAEFTCKYLQYATDSINKLARHLDRNNEKLSPLSKKLIKTLATVDFEPFRSVFKEAKTLSFRSSVLLGGLKGPLNVIGGKRKRLDVAKAAHNVLSCLREGAKIAGKELCEENAFMIDLLGQGTEFFPEKDKIKGGTTLESWQSKNRSLRSILLALGSAVLIVKALRMLKEKGKLPEKSAQLNSIDFDLLEEGLKKIKSGISDVQTLVLMRKVYLEIKQKKNDEAIKEAALKHPETAKMSVQDTLGLENGSANFAKILLDPRPGLEEQQDKVMEIVKRDMQKALQGNEKLLEEYSEENLVLAASMLVLGSGSKARDFQSEADEVPQVLGKLSLTQAQAIFNTESA